VPQCGEIGGGVSRTLDARQGVGEEIAEVPRRHPRPPRRFLVNGHESPPVGDDVPGCEVVVLRNGWQVGPTLDEVGRSSESAPGWQHLVPFRSDHDPEARHDAWLVGLKPSREGRPMLCGTQRTGSGESWPSHVTSEWGARAQGGRRAVTGPTVRAHGQPKSVGHNVSVPLTVQRIVTGPIPRSAAAALERVRRRGKRARWMTRRSLARAARRAGVVNPRPAVLMYHRIALDRVDPWGIAVSPARFDEQVRWLSRHRKILPLAEFARLQQEALLPTRAVAITFDDGYACNATAAAPVLEAHRVAATFFVATEPVVAGQEFWWDELQRIVLHSSAVRLELMVGPRNVVLDLGRRSTEMEAWSPGSAPSSRRQHAYLKLWHALRALNPTTQANALTQLRAQTGVPITPRDSHRPLTLLEVQELSRSDVVEFGCHTLTHPSLPLQTPEVQQAEIGGGRQACAKITGRLPTTFAYPFGEYDASIVDLVRSAGYDAACTTRETAVTRSCDTLALPRLQVMDWSAAQLATRLQAL
jgi:peptidoglycan/xylan/chitin deacetylase (PgdA/CDA1 family)